MKILKTIKAYELYRNNTKKHSLGFIPTMGALHQGHISLVEKSIKQNLQTVVSIYVNPTQFDQVDDLNNYPSILEQDLKLLEIAGVDAVFIPNYREIYPDNYSFHIHEDRLSKMYCGAHREGHFNGVLTVVMRLLNIIVPSKAYFGEKDFQQLTLIKQMVKAFFMRTEIIGCPIIREADGLAMSSRNLRLNPQQRKLASKLYKVINSNLNIDQMYRKLSTLGFDVDYIETMDKRLLVAAYIEEIRLIDNVEFKQFKEKVA